MSAGPPRVKYEEYHPYGSTAWWSNNGDSEVSQKRYRYTGMERDEETGLQCHGVRYYAVWLGRWTSADPIGLGDGVNRYAYCHGNPASSIDPAGTADALPQDMTDAGWTVLNPEDSASVVSLIHPSASTEPKISAGVEGMLREVRSAVASASPQLDVDGVRKEVGTKAQGMDWKDQVEAGRVFVELADHTVIASPLVLGDKVTIGEQDSGHAEAGDPGKRQYDPFAREASTFLGGLLTTPVQGFLAKNGIEGVLEVHKHPLSATSTETPSLPSHGDMAQLVSQADAQHVQWEGPEHATSEIVLDSKPMAPGMTLTSLPKGFTPLNLRPEAAGALGHLPGDYARWLTPLGGQIYTGALPSDAAKPATLKRQRP
jgi:RHS repeat-associated protein